MFFDAKKAFTENFYTIRRRIIEAAKQNIRLLVFPECALTGYPPRNIKSSANVDFEKLDRIYRETEKMAREYNMYILVDTITKEQSEYYNSARLVMPNGKTENYDKRALWGWDKDNFSEGRKSGIFEIDSIKIGVRICFEVRFPEFFRELYLENTALNIIMFYDVSDSDDIEFYEVIKSHVRTRAVENVTCTMSVNSIHLYQTAPTGVFNKSGYALEELKIICKDMGIAHTGTKQELNENIQQYFMGNIVRTKKPRSRKKSECPLSLESKLLECGFSFNQKFQGFFSEITGIENFKFNADMATSRRVVKKNNDVDFKIQDMLDVYYGTKECAKYDNSVWQWNQFLKDFSAYPNSASYTNKLKVASILWKQVRDSTKQKIYSISLLGEYGTLIEKFKI